MLPRNNDHLFCVYASVYMLSICNYIYTLKDRIRYLLLSDSLNKHINIQFKKIMAQP